MSERSAQIEVALVFADGSSITGKSPPRTRTRLLRPPT
jgi:hypothetical protein